jgi:hypothetical protein
MLHEVPKKDITQSSQYHLVIIHQNENYILSLTANKLQMQAKKSTKFLSNPSSLHVGKITNCISLLQEQKTYETMASFMK